MKWFLLSLILICEVSFSAIPMQPSNVQKSTLSLVGGSAGLGFSLLDIRSTHSKNKERVVIDIGGMKGSSLKGRPGYFHAQVLENPHRLVIDFAQMPASKIDIKTLNKKLSQSLGIKSSQMSLDPVDQTLSLVFELKNKPQVKVYQVAGVKSTSKVVVDLNL
jgi:hypothetical protein